MVVEWAVVFVVEWAVGSVVAWAVDFTVAWVDSTVALPALDHVGDTVTVDFEDMAAMDLEDTAATIQGTGSSSALASHIGLITVQDGAILTMATPPILTGPIRTRMVMRIHRTTTDMCTARPPRPPALKLMEDRSIK